MAGVINMIDDEIRKKIEKTFPEHSDLKNFDIYFKENYKINQEGYDFIVLYPSHPKAPCMVFDMEGKFAGIEDIDFAREYGELL